MNVTWLECMVVMTSAILVSSVANGALFSVPDLYRVLVCSDYSGVVAIAQRTGFTMKR